MTKNIYTILNILLIGAIIFLGVDTFYRIFEARLDQPDFAKTPEIKKTGEKRKSRVQRLSDYEIINRRSIFGKIAQSDLNSSEELPDLENLEPTSLNISLIATFVVDQEYSAAVISVKSKRPPQDTYHIGDSVEGALIKNILRNKVILSIKGKDQILARDEESTPTGSASSPSSRPPVNQASSTPLTRSIQLQRDDIDEALGDIQNLLTQASIKPHFTDGEPDGLAITGVKSNSIFRKMGFRNGDIVKSVEGQEIKSPEDLISFYDDLQSADSVSIQYIRRGQERTNELKLR